MIVEPDFFDHWKTLVLIDLLGDEKAPLYVLRLWAHCQNRKKSSFESLSPRALKALCRYSGSEETLLCSLVEAGFVTMSQCGRLDVLGWDDYNAKLISNWGNGVKGGRPKKPNGNPTETQGEPTDNPPGTHSEPIRVDKSRVEENIKPPPNPQGGTGGGEPDQIGPEPGQDRSSVDQQPSYSVDFEVWWQCYPKQRRSKKAEAYRRWKQAIKKADPELLIAKVRQYAKSPVGQTQFAVTAPVWLNAGMWEDDPESWDRSNGQRTEDAFFDSIPKVG